MNPFTCVEIEDRLDLYAAGECDEPEADAVRRHLQSCPQCSRAYVEAQQLVGLLAARFQETERLHQLRTRLDAEVIRRVPQSRTLSFVRKLAALAAMLLVVVVLFYWLSLPWQPGEIGPDDLRASAANDYQTWPEIALQGPPTKVLAREAMVPGRDKARLKVPRFALIQAPPGVRWEPFNARQLRLTEGKLRVKGPKARGAVAEAVEVITPVAATTVRGTDFIIQVGPVNAPNRAKDNRWTKHRPPPLQVVVLAGEVRMSNPKGTVTGSRGDYLWISAKGLPRKQER